MTSTTPSTAARRIRIVSDGTGETASQATHAAMIQFSDSNVEFCRHQNVRTPQQVDDICEDAILGEDLIIHTLVSSDLRTRLVEKAREHQIACVDLMGPLLAGLATFFGHEPKAVAGLLHGVNDRYFRRVEAMEYTLAHDDGRDLTGLEKADLVVLGVSRTSKTPLAMYLSHQGWKVATIPVMIGFDPPKEIFALDQRKIVGLTIDSEELVRIRKNRSQRLGQDDTSEYADPEKIEAEVEYAREFFRKNATWPVFNIAGKALEETASEIIQWMASKRLTPVLNPK